MVAVDMPSGLASDAQDLGGPVISADFTVTFTAPKLGQLVLPRASSCGVLVVRNIGTPPELLESDPHLKIHWIEPGEFRALPLARDPVREQGNLRPRADRRRVAREVGRGSLGGRGALRSGAGLVTVATPLDVLPMVAAGMPEMMTVPLAATEAGTASLRNIDYGRFAEITAQQVRSRYRPGAVHAAVKRSNSSASSFRRRTFRSFWMPMA